MTGAEVTADFFAVLGVVPYLGSTFREEHQRPGTRAAILSRRLWERRYGGDPKLVGGTVVIEGEAYTVLGVMPAGFSFPENAECWTVLTMTEDGMKVARQPGGSVSVQPARLRGIGRLTPDGTIEAAQLEGQRCWRDVRRCRPPFSSSACRTCSSVQFARLLLILQGAVLLLLTMVCGNVISLLLARGESRRRELAVRLALGRAGGDSSARRSRKRPSRGRRCGVERRDRLLAHRGIQDARPAEVPRLNEVELDGVVNASSCGTLGVGRAGVRRAAGVARSRGYAETSRCVPSDRARCTRRTRRCALWSSCGSPRRWFCSPGARSGQAVWRLTRVRSGLARRVS